MTDTDIEAPWSRQIVIRQRGWYRLEIGPAPEGQRCYVRCGLADVMQDAYVPGLPIGPGYADEQFVVVTKVPSTLRIEAHGTSADIPIRVARIGALSSLKRLIGRAWQELTSDPGRFASHLRAWLTYRIRMAPRGLINLSTGKTVVDYPTWIRLYDAGPSAQTAADAKPMVTCSAGPFSALIIDAADDPAAVELTRSWLANIAPPPTRIVVLGKDGWHNRVRVDGTRAASASSPVESCLQSPNLFVVEAGVLPRRHAFCELASALELPGTLAAIADYDFLDTAGRRFSPVLGASFDRFHSAEAGQCGGTALLSKKATADLPLLAAAVPPITVAALVQELSKRHGETCIQHVPLILSHVSHCVQPERLRMPPAVRDARWPRPGATAGPQLSLIIPSRDRIDLLSMAVQTLFIDPADPRLELIVVDHASERPETAAYLRKVSSLSHCRVVRVEGPFNFSRLVNLGATAASGELLCLANDDIEATGERWIEPVLAAAAEPDVGAVGAKLLYPDGRLQHAGVAIGLYGLAAHIGQFRASDDPGPGRILCGTRTWSAVTGAFLVTPRSLFQGVGGFDERLAIEFGDVDYCLRLAEAGYRSLCLNDVKLVHHESQSRGQPKHGPIHDQVQRDRALMQRLWARKLALDKWYPPNLSHSGTNLSLAAPPLRRRPA